MSHLFLLSEAQIRRREPFFPLSHGIRRVDDWGIVSGIVYVIKHGLMWRDARFGRNPSGAFGSTTNNLPSECRPPLVSEVMVTI